MVFIVAGAWHLHGPSHQVHVNSLGRIRIGTGYDLRPSAALVLGYKAKTVFVFSRSEFVGTGSRVALGEILET